MGAVARATGAFVAAGIFTGIGYLGGQAVEAHGCSQSIETISAEECANRIEGTENSLRILTIMGGVGMAATGIMIMRAVRDERDTRASEVLVNRRH